MPIDAFAQQAREPLHGRAPVVLCTSFKRTSEVSLSPLSLETLRQRKSGKQVERGEKQEREHSIVLSLTRVRDNGDRLWRKPPHVVTIVAKPGDSICGPTARRARRDRLRRRRCRHRRRTCP